jgi:peptide subunit release factor 1 (eRF1)
MDVKASEDQVLRATLEAVREDDAKNDKEKIERLFNESRSGGLGIVGAKETLTALKKGQVEELILSASRTKIRQAGKAKEKTIPVGGFQPLMVADTLVTCAHQTAAKVTFVEDPTLLESVGGVGALLRYRPQ